MQQQLHALHGFLGRPQDWNAFNFACEIHAIDLFDRKFFSHELGLDQCAKNFQIANQNTRRILMGYSLGGRLALHLLKHQPGLWHGAIFISTHPGLECHEDKIHRLKTDEQWANRFRMEPWNELMHDWNSQPVFQGHEKERLEQDYNRSALANVLDYWSLGHQQNFSEELQSKNFPILWIAGEKDHRYASITQGLCFQHSMSRKWIATNSGHRVPWEKPREFEKQVNEFLFELNQKNH